MQVSCLKPEIGEGYGLLSWVRQGFRQYGVFAAIQPAVDADLLARAVTAIRSWGVDGPGAEAMAAAIVARGGAKVGEQQVVTALGTIITCHEYLRPQCQRGRPGASPSSTRCACDC
jgi:hypothetical protein